jgi:excinuclease ABC subunit B
LREGLDLPEVSLVAILDADKEGFLRDQRSLVQTVGRAARNLNGTVIMYADKMTKSMQYTIDETARRRMIQTEYNTLHGKVPMALNKSLQNILESTTVAENETQLRDVEKERKHQELMASEPQFEYQTEAQLKNEIASVKKKMEKAAKELDFMEAARLRDILLELQKKLK